MPSRRSHRWYMDRRIKGVGRVNKALDTTDKATAHYRESILLKLANTGRLDVIHALNDGRVSTAEVVYAYEKGPESLQELVEWHGDPYIQDLIDPFIEAKSTEIKTAERYRTSLRALPNMRISRLARPDTINGFKRDRLATGLSPDSVCRDLAAIHQLLEYHGGKKLARKAFDDVRWPTTRARRTRKLSKPEIKLLLMTAWAAQQNSKHPYRDIYYIILATGLRPSEVLRIKWTDVDRDKKVLRVPVSKTKQGIREVPATDEVIRLIFEHARGTTSFPETCFTVGDNTLSYVFADHAAAAGLKDVKLRDLRRTHAQFIREAEKDIVKARDQLGHTTVTQTERYVGSSTAEDRRGMVEEAIELMGL